MTCPHCHKPMEFVPAWRDHVGPRPGDIEHHGPMWVCKACDTVIDADELDDPRGGDERDEQ